MSDYEILKHLPEVAKVVTPLAAAIPFTGIVKRMLGPAADEVAEMWKDQIRLYRYGRQLKCIEKAEQMAKDAGFTPKAVPPKILFPLLEGVSMEEDETLHTMWAALLANSSSPLNTEIVRPGFIAVLRHMAPDEASIINWLYDHWDDWSRLHGVAAATLSQARDELGFRDKERVERTLSLSQRFVSCLDGLEAEQLIRRYYVGKPNSSPEAMLEDSFLPFSYLLTRRCEEFMVVCRPPRTKP